MKTILLFSLIITCFFSISCENDDAKDENKSSTTEYTKSAATWNKLKVEKGNSYFYKVTTHSFFGFASETTITITNGIATNRRYTSYTIEDSNITDLLTYEEDSSNLGNHKEGFNPLTLDQIYETCREDLNTDPTKNEIIFTTFENGLLKVCGFIPNGCQDDCFSGITIAEITFLN